MMCSLAVFSAPTLAADGSPASCRLATADGLPSGRGGGSRWSGIERVGFAARAITGSGGGSDGSRWSGESSRAASPGVAADCFSRLGTAHVRTRDGETTTAWDRQRGHRLPSLASLYPPSQPLPCGPPPSPPPPPRLHLHILPTRQPCHLHTLP
jgi:hypothetical protein